MKLGNKLRTVAVVAAISLAFTAAGCGGGGDGGGEATPGAEASAPAEDANLAITFLPKNLGNPYFDTSDKGGETAIKEFGGTYAEVGPAEATPDAQVSYINTLTQQQVGAIADRGARRWREGGHLRFRHQSGLPRSLCEPSDRRGHRQGSD